MWQWTDMVQRVLCLLLGYAFGVFPTAAIVCRLITGESCKQVGDGTPTAENLTQQLGKGAGAAVVAGDIIKTAAACGICWLADSPFLGHTAVLYGGLGALLGHLFPLWNRGRGGRGAAVLCVWLICYLPITGVLCCLAGGALSVGVGQMAVGIVGTALAAVLLAWLQFGMESGVVMIAAALLMLQRQWHILVPVVRGWLEPDPRQEDREP